MGDVIRILKRLPGRTVIARGGGVEVRFDSTEEREVFEAQLQVRRLVSEKQDVTRAAQIVVDLLDRGVIEEAGELLEVAAIDEVSSEIVSLEVDQLVHEALERSTAAVKTVWPDREEE